MPSSPSPDDTQRASDALTRLTSLHPKLIDLGLDRTFDLLARLGNPHHRLPPVIHVAGTNGKGSVIALMRAMAEAGGLRVHCYVSPHLCRFNERIRLAGNLIGDGELASLLEEVEAANGDMPVTFFEVTTAAAFLAFSRVEADLLLLETGLGGMLDSTNVLSTPAATIITPVARDHEHFLGSDLAGIASQKAGIMRGSVPCFSAAQQPQVMAALDTYASHLGTEVTALGRDIGWTPNRDGGIDIDMHSAAGTRRIRLPAPSLHGPHQQANMALAVAALVCVLPDLADDDLAAGVQSAIWPGRLQRLSSGPLSRLVERPVWIDGAHNAHGADALAAALPGIDARKWHFICGALDTRPADEFLHRIAPLAASLQCVAIPDQPASLSAADLARAAQHSFPAAQSARSVADALKQLADGPADSGLPVMICGSLYLAGHVLAQNASLPD
ncbi:folylpolyglutamate synthase/dihydrofolate synthase family protein [Alphaproteobacteria bacterium LSUCC0719]